jgi:hypothetical protein
MEDYKEPSSPRTYREIDVMCRWWLLQPVDIVEVSVYEDIWMQVRQGGRSEAVDGVGARVLPQSGQSAALLRQQLIM